MLLLVRLLVSYLYALHMLEAATTRTYTHPKEICIGETVMANPKPGFPAVHVAAVIKKRLGPLTYLVETQSS